MSKRTVRLTESELKNIITESVKNIISELDHKTLKNAARKALERGEVERAYNFDTAAVDAFNRDFGYDGKDGHYRATRRYKMRDFMPKDNPIYYDTDYHAIDGNGEEYYGAERFQLTPNEKGYYPIIPGVERRLFKDYSRPLGPEAHIARQKGHDEIDNYRKGNYEYTKGKGWHLKDNE